MMNEEIHASFWAHLDELRTCLIQVFITIFIGLLLSVYFYKELLQFFIFHVPGASLFLFSPAEGFIAVFKLSFWLGILGTSPFWLRGLIRFFKPGLKNKEKDSVFKFVFLSFLFISAGFVLCLQITLPLAIDYLYVFNQTIGTNIWGVGAYLDFVLMLLFAHGMAFEIGALLFFMIHLKILNASQLKTKRRHAVVASLIIGALLTPPDVITQICVALPLICFYELAILYGRTISSPEHE